MVAVAKICALRVTLALLTAASSHGIPKHHHHHHKHHHHNATQTPAVKEGSPQRHATVAMAESDHLAAPQRHAHSTAVGSSAALDSHAQELGIAKLAAQTSSDGKIMERMQKVEKEVVEKEQTAKTNLARGHLIVNGPLPVDFSSRFAQGVAAATGCRPEDVNLLGAVPVPEGEGIEEELMFRSRQDVVTAVEDQASDPSSKLARGVLHSFLVSRDEPDDQVETDKDEHEKHDEEEEEHNHDDKGEDKPGRKHKRERKSNEAPEVDMTMPYGDLEPFGREDTAQELTESSIRESDAMVDQLERAEVAEEKRAVFRALTRLRGAAITSYDGIARSQTGNIDEYARGNQWRKAHSLHHLAQEEADVSRWAFPDDDDADN